jgi:hypothetical protein
VKKKILVNGPVLSQSGYGEQSRFALRALKSREDEFEIFINPINWGQTGWVWQDDDFRQWMDEKITTTQILLSQQKLRPDMSLQITIPNEWQKMAPINIGYTAGIETNKVSPLWLQKGNEMDNIIVVSEHSKNVFQNTKGMIVNKNTNEQKPFALATSINSVGYPVRIHEPEPIPNLELSTDFNFLVVSQMGPRKNLENTVSWFVEEFIDQEVGLVIKTNIKSNCYFDWEATSEHFEMLLSKYPQRKCKVYILHGDLTDGQMTWLYKHDKMKALINIAHGEGFGLPMFEATQNALPVITVRWSGQMDFLHHDGKDYFSKVDFTMRPVQKEAVWDTVIDKDSMWAYADQGSYKMKLREMKKNWSEQKQLAEELKTIILDKFEEQKMYAKFVDLVCEKELIVNDDEIEKLFLEAASG